MPLPSSSGIFFLRNHNTGKYAAVNGSSIVAAPTPFRPACQWKIVSAGAGQTLQNVGSGLYYAQGEMHSTFTGVTARSDPFVVFFEEDEADKNIFYFFHWQYIISLQRYGSLSPLRGVRCIPRYQMESENKDAMGSRTFDSARY
ncbi:hypothetical protein CPC08DRAFT_39736 [Agrocybe pediades]|nr:hypothetical protein CPC08DRAFT_39736 [Agrocybe pediades]